MSALNKSEKALRASPVESGKFSALPTALSKSPFSFSCHLLPVICPVFPGAGMASVHITLNATRCWGGQQQVLRSACMFAKDLCSDTWGNSRPDSQRPCLHRGAGMCCSAYMEVLLPSEDGLGCMWQASWELASSPSLGKKVDIWGWGQQQKPQHPTMQA